MQGHRQIIAYIAVGLLGVLFDAGTFVLMSSWGFSLVVAQWAAAFVGTTHNHVWHFTKVFDHTQGFGKTYVLTLLVAAVFIIASGFLLPPINHLVQHVWVSKGLIIVLTGSMSFLVRKTFIFQAKA
jgi:putative flippase GtrA